MSWRFVSLVTVFIAVYGMIAIATITLGIIPGDSMTTGFLIAGVSYLMAVLSAMAVMEWRDWL